MDRLLFTVGEVAESLALSRSTLYRLIASGELLGADCPMTDQEIKAMLDSSARSPSLPLTPLRPNDTAPPPRPRVPTHEWRVPLPARQHG